MTQSSKLRFFNGFRASNKQKKQTPSQPDTTVEGWLMNVHTYRDPEEILATIVDGENNSIPIETSQLKKPRSIISEDSVNLDELINANFTTDMDEETALPDLADLDLDDSVEDFWKLDKNEPLNILDTSFDHLVASKSIIKNYDLDWSPTENNANNLKTSLPATASFENDSRGNRSGSISSENSLISQSTVTTQYAKYGLTPIYLSDSSSTSSRSLSRLSNYSTTSSNATSGIPLARKNSTTNTIPTPSRSNSLRDIKKNQHEKHNSVLQKGFTKRTQLVKRASHIPAPTSTLISSPPPSPQRTLSSSSNTSSPGASRIRTPTQKGLMQRASHIPTVKERSSSPLLQGRASATPTRMRSPTPGSPRHSLFSPKEENRVTSPTSPRSSVLRSQGSSLRSPSRIGTLKRT